MPYDKLQRRDDEEERRKQLGMADTSVAAPVAPVAGAATAPAAQRTVAPTMAKGGQASIVSPYSIGAQNAGSTGGSRRVGGRFVNFGTLYGLNKEAAEKSAGKVAGDAYNKGSTASKAITAAGDRFRQNVAGGMVKYNPIKVSPVAPTVSTRSAGVGEAKQGLQGETTRPGAAQGGPVTPGGPVDPTATGSRDELVTAAGQKYSGPTSLEQDMGDADFDALTEQARKAQAANQLLDTPGGIEAALGYTGSTGASRMDAGLAQGAGQGAFRALAKRYGNLSGQLANEAAGAKKLAAGAEGDSMAAAAKYQSDLAELDAAQGKLNSERAQSDADRIANDERAKREDALAGFTMQWLANMGLPDTPENRAKAQKDFETKQYSDERLAELAQAGAFLRSGGGTRGGDT